MMRTRHSLVEQGNEQESGPYNDSDIDRESVSDILLCCWERLGYYGPMHSAEPTAMPAAAPAQMNSLRSASFWNIAATGTSLSASFSFRRLPLMQQKMRSCRSCQRMKRTADEACMVEQEP